jgi:hypothetical protein
VTTLSVPYLVMLSLYRLDDQQGQEFSSLAPGLEQLWGLCLASHFSLGLGGVHLLYSIEMHEQRGAGLSQ